MCAQHPPGLYQACPLGAYPIALSLQMSEPPQTPEAASSMLSGEPINEHRLRLAVVRLLLAPPPPRLVHYGGDVFGLVAVRGPQYHRLHRVRAALAVDVVEDDVLGAGQGRHGVHGGRDVEEGELQVRRRGGRLLGKVIAGGQGVVVAAARQVLTEISIELLQAWSKRIVQHKFVGDMKGIARSAISKETSPEYIHYR